MRRVFIVVGVVLSFFIGGCAIHPVPQDVTGIDTYDIVRQIRCEARETIREEVITWLKKLAAFGDARAQQLVLQYDTDPELISNFHYNLFDAPDEVKIKAVAKLFYDTGIAYNFDLTMTEDNGLSAGATFTRPVLNPVVTLGVAAGAARQRSNHRTFVVTDTFSYLLTKLNTPVRGHRYCDGQLVGPNYVYPIAGRIGIDKMVRDFINLTLFASLSEPTAKPGAVGAPTMADELTFTTNLSGSINPVAVFTPVTNAFQLTNASLTAGADRIDVHKVAVALAITPTGIAELGPVRSFLFSRDRSVAGGVAGFAGPSGARVVSGLRVTGIARTASEALAITAIDQLKSRELQLIPPP